MTGPHAEQYRHEVTPWTVGQLSAAMANLPDDALLEVAVAEEPGGIFINNQVVIDVATEGNGVTIACEYPSGNYLRRRTTTRSNSPSPGQGRSHLIVRAARPLLPSRYFRARHGM